LTVNFTDVYGTCEEVATGKTSALAYSTSFTASESQNMYVNADQTENSIGSAEDSVHTHTGELHKHGIETEECDHDKQVDALQGSAHRVPIVE
jgi:hypothetical protein